MASNKQKNSSDRELIGARFKEFRKKHGVLQTDFKEVITPVMISRIENGKVLPSAEVMVYLMKNYGLDANWLLTGTASNKKVDPSDELLARLALSERRTEEIYRLVKDKLGI